MHIWERVHAYQFAHLLPKEKIVDRKKMKVICRFDSSIHVTYHINYTVNNDLHIMLTTLMTTSIHAIRDVNLFPRRKEFL